MALNYSTSFRAMIRARILLTLYLNIKILKNWGGHSFREKHSLEVKCFERSVELGICDLCNSIWTCWIFLARISLASFCFFSYRKYIWHRLGMLNLLLSCHLSIHSDNICLYYWVRNTEFLSVSYTQCSLWLLAFQNLHHTAQLVSRMCTRCPLRSAYTHLPHSSLPVYQARLKSLGTGYCVLCILCCHWAGTSAVRRGGLLFFFWWHMLFCRQMSIYLWEWFVMVSSIRYWVW